MNFEFDSFSRRMAEKYSKHFGVCADCIRSADSFLESIEGLGIGAENFTAVQLAISANFFKVCNSLISAYFLADAGLVEDVKTMTRKIIDLTVNMKYLSLDSDKRAADYLAFEAIHRKTTLDRVRSGAIPTSAFVQSGFECNASRIEAEYTTAIARYGQASKDEIGLRKRSWSGKFFTQMAKEAGLQNYVVPYELFCSATHADPGDIRTYWKEHDGKVGFVEEDDSIPSLLWTGSHAFVVYSEVLLAAFDLDPSPALEKILVTLVQLDEDMATSNEGESSQNN